MHKDFHMEPLDLKTKLTVELKPVSFLKSRFSL